METAFAVNAKEMKPKLSVVLPAMLGYDSVLAPLDTWESQACRDQLEILVLYPDHLGPTEAQLAAMPAGQVLIPVGTADLHQARAIGIGRASADYVMLAEDHCVPDPGWARAILARIEEGCWDGIGPALRPGNRSSCWTEGSFLIGYGEWMIPIRGGPAKVLCGWNVILRTKWVRRAGAGLAEELLIGAFLVRRLRREGARFYLEESARMRHFDPPGWAHEIFLVGLVGLGFGAKRTRDWPLLARLLYPLAFPAIAFLHWRRGLVQYLRAGRGCGLRVSTLGAAMALAAAWGLGEAAGAWLGTARVAPHLWRTEVKPVSRENLAVSTALEERFGLPAGAACDVEPTNVS